MRVIWSPRLIEMLDMKKTTILLFCDYYVPSYKAGGPPRVLENMSERIGDEILFKIICRDRDYRENRPFDNVKRNIWSTVGKADVYYASPGPLFFWKILKILISEKYDKIYLNSLYSSKFSICVILLKNIFMLKSAIILAPRGELLAGAISYKTKRKKLFIKIISNLKVYKKIHWHATSEEEQTCIKTLFPDSNVTLISDFMPSLKSGDNQHVDVSIDEYEKKSNELRVIWVARVAENKNLDFALDVLSSYEGKVQFDIYGEIDNHDYWNHCLEKINASPKRVRINYVGSLPHKQILEAYTKYDFFFLPTKGENYGVSIIEALTAGLPVLISDQTPWTKSVHKICGFAISLQDIAGYREAISEFGDMDSKNMVEYKKMCRVVALKTIAAVEDENKMINLLTD